MEGAVFCFTWHQSNPNLTNKAPEISIFMFFCFLERLGTLICDFEYPNYFNKSKKIQNHFWRILFFEYVEFENLICLKIWNLGTLESCNLGILESWNLGILKSGNLEILESWNLGTLGTWKLGNFGTLNWILDSYLIPNTYDV